MSQLVILEKRQISKSKRTELEDAGYVVLEVKDINKVLLAESVPRPAPPSMLDDGFDLGSDHAS